MGWYIFGLFIAFIVGFGVRNDNEPIPIKQQKLEDLVHKLGYEWEEGGIWINKKKGGKYGRIHNL